MDEALKSLEREVDVIDLIRSNRFVHIALRHLLQPVLYEELKAQSKFVDIVSQVNPSSEKELDDDISKEV